MRGYRVMLKAVTPPFGIYKGAIWLEIATRFYEWIGPRARCIARAKQARSRLWANRQMLYGYGKSERQATMRWFGKLNAKHAKTP